MPIDQPEWVPAGRFAVLRAGRDATMRAAGLWSAGRLEGLARPCVAIVGTRAATQYGLALARRFAADLGSAGCCIVSGLALGIDAAAHEGALDAGVPTVGVLGCGHRRFFPARNLNLARRMIQSGGAVLSPYEPDAVAYPSNFLERNGIVAALADALVVIEAPERSGALNTASWAAPRIPVLAVPGDVDRAHVAGCHALIRDGATLARDSNDVLEALGVGNTMPLPLARVDESASPLERAILDALESGEREFDDLVVVCGESPAALLSALTNLELGGTVARSGPSRYARAASAILRK